MTSDEPEFTVIDSRIGILKRDLTESERFHLGAAKLHPAFKCLKDVVLMASAAVLRDLARPVALFFRLGLC